MQGLLYVTFLAGLMDCAPEDVPMTHGHPDEIATLLFDWATLMKDAIAGHDIAYEARGEAEADAYLEALEAEPLGVDHILSGRAAKVLAERALYACSLMTLKGIQGESVIIPPPTLSKGHRMAAAALWSLHKMERPPTAR